MKKRLLWALLSWLSLLSFGARAQTNVLLAQENFENGTAGTNPTYGYTANNFQVTTNTQYFQRQQVNAGLPAYPGTTQQVTNIEGSYAWTAEGVRGTGTQTLRSAGYVVLNPVPASGYRNFRMEVAFADPSGTNCGTCSRNAVLASDRVRLQYSFDNGPFVTAGLLANSSSGYWQQDTSAPLDSVADGTIINQDFKNIVANISGTGSSLRVRVVCDFRSPILLFDNIRVYGDVNAVPTPTLNGLEATAASYTEGGSPVQLTNALTTGYSDNSAPNFTGGTVSVSANFVNGDQLNFTNQNGITGTYTPGNGILALTGTASQAAYQAALRSITYSSTNTTTLNTGTRQITFQVRNGSVVSNSPVRTLNITGVLNAPAALNYTEDFTADADGTRYFGNTWADVNIRTGSFWATTSPAVYNGTQIGSATFTGQSGGYWFGESPSTTLNPTNPYSVVQLAPVNAAGRSNIRFTVAIGAAGPWDGYTNANNVGDQFELFYSTDGGTTLTKFGAFYGVDSSTPARQDADLDPLTPATGTLLGTALQDFTFNIPASAAVSNLTFVLRQRSRAAGIELAYDNIRITAAVPPTVTTGTAGSLTTATAVISNNTLTADGGATLSDYGVVYVAGTGTPTTSNTKAQAGTSSPGSFPASFTVNLSGLTPGTQYTVRAYATNASGTSYGASVTFTTAAPTITVAPATLPAGTVAVAYSQTLTASGGTAPYTYALASGSLPAGLTLASSGTLSGTPTAGGTFNFMVRATDASTPTAFSGTQTYALVISAPTIVVSPVSLPIGTQGTAYSQALTASGGTAPYTFAITAGALPSGLTLTSAGTLSGTPTVNGSFNFTVTATDASTGSGPYSGMRSYTLTIAAPATTTVTLTQVTPSPTATTTVTYRATFGAAVAGLNTSNFSVANAGTTVTGASVASVTAVSTTAYNVVVNTGTGSGTLVLQLVNSTGVTPTVSGLPASGPSYTITKSFAAAPTLRIQAAGSASGNGDVTAFVDVVQVLQSGTSTAVANAVQNNSFETNNVNPGDFKKTADGVVASPWSFTSLAGVSRNNSAFGSTAADGDAVAVVQSVGGDNGNLSQNLAVPTGSYQVRFQTIQRNYTSLDQRLNVFVNDVFVGNIQPNNIPTYDIFTSAIFAVTAPALTATVSTTSASPTSTSPIPFSVSFSQSVGTTFTASDVTVTGGTLNTASFGGSGSGPYTFTVTPTGAGTVTVSLVANVANDANNTGNAASNSLSVQYQQPVTAAPVLTSPANGATTTSLPTFAGTAPAGSTVTIYLTPSGGTAQSLGATTATGGSFSFTPATALASGTYSVYATAQSSGAAVSATSNTSTFTVDATAPTVLSSNRQSPAANPTNATTLTYRVTFSEGVTGVTANDFTLTSTGTATGTTSAVAAVSASVYDVTVSSASGNGTLRLDLNSTGTGIADLAGNALAGGYTSGQSYTLDNAAPTATITTAAANPTSTSPIPFTVAFSEAVTGFAASGITVTNGTITTAITNVGNAYSFSVTPTSNGAVTVSVAANAAQDAAGNGNAAAGPLSVTYTAPITLTIWTGAISTDWFTAGNWTAGVPTATIDATIPGAPSGGRFPAVSAGTANVRNLTFNSGATLNQSGGTIAIAANLTNNGTFLPTGGTVSLGSTTLSNVLGSGNIRFWNLTVGASGAQLSTSIGASVQRLLTLNGNFATNGNQFVLESTNTLTALVANNNSSVVTGTVTVQRAIDPSVNPGLGYRHYSSPVSNSTVGDLATSGFTPVVNPAFNSVASPYTILPYPTVYGYDDSRLSLTNNLDMFDKGYFSPNALSDPLAVGKGYTVYIGASEVVDFQGTLNNGDLPLNLTSTRNTYPDGGWQFLGNPYPAPLDYSRVAAADRIGLESAIYVYSSTSQYIGRYRVYINGIGNPVVPMGQGFFARVASGQATATMNFRNSQRLTAPNGTTLQRTAADPRPLVQLTLQGASPALADEAYVYFENGATSGFEPEFDAEKLANSTGLNLSTNLANGQHLSIDGQPELGTSQRVVPLAVGVPAAGVYTFTASQLLNLGAVPVYLRDRQLGTLTDLRQQPSYQFTVANAAALNTTRFELVFSPQRPLATVPAALAQQVALYPNPARTQVAIELPLGLSRQPVTASLLDALGRVVRTQVLPAGLATHTLPLADLATGVYSLRLTTEMGTVVKKLIVE